MERLRSMVALLLLLLCGAGLSACAGARADLEAQAGAVGARLHVALLPLDGNTPTVRLHADALVTPASVMKLLTAATALQLAPAETPLRTEVRLIDDTGTRSTLLLRGGGDPLLEPSHLDALAAAVAPRLQQRSVNISWQDSLFTGPAWGQGWMWDDGLDTMRISALRLRNATTTDPSEHAATLLAASLKQHGVTVTDLRRAESADLGMELSVQTHALAEVLRRQLEDSDNIAAECVLRLLPVFSGAASGSAAAGLKCVAGELRRCGVDPATLVLADGSGFSRYNHITADAVVNLLHCHEREHPGRLRALLPRAGETGTLTRRFTGTCAVGRLQAKTGSLEGVSTLAGYLCTLSGRPCAFAIAVQHSSAAAPELRRIVDATALALIEERF